MKFKTWLRFEFHKDTVINEINPEVQTSSGFLILRQDGAWSGSLDHAKLFSRNKAQRLCDKMNKRSMKYGKEHGKPYSVYNIITKRDTFATRKIHYLGYILHKLYRQISKLKNSSIYS